MSDLATEVVEHYAGTEHGYEPALAPCRLTVDGNLEELAREVIRLRARVKQVDAAHVEKRQQAEAIYDARVTELLDANNREVERRREAERVWGELAAIVGCGSPSGSAELDQVRYLKEIVDRRPDPTLPERYSELLAKHELLEEHHEHLRQTARLFAEERGWICGRRCATAGSAPPRSAGAARRCWRCGER